ncbi:hypothetical protein [Hamadaea tsunoensis]|uniref:hypothetical protein n=1 Tax=Hamadaea tsunoensis TaxID=53368 RepID=UPI000484CBF1|nr:hypothetical protein [Hamadaea tsunoensis]
MKRWPLLLGTVLLAGCGSPTATPQAAAPSAATSATAGSPSVAPKPSPSRKIDWSQVAQGAAADPSSVDASWGAPIGDFQVERPLLPVCGKEVLKPADKAVAWERTWGLRAALVRQTVYAFPDPASARRILGAAGPADARCPSYKMQYLPERHTAVVPTGVQLNSDVPSGHLRCDKVAWTGQPLRYECTAVFGYGHLVSVVSSTADNQHDAERDLHDLLYASLNRFDLIARAAS